MNEFQMKVQ